MDDRSDREKFAVRLAMDAGKLGLKYFQNLDTLSIESKGHQDLVSQADRDVETFVRQAIADAYPDDGIVCEEHASKQGRSGFDWVIDPIDGTANFVRGIPAWTVVIAGVRDGVSEVAVIHEPCTGESFHGHLGGGAYLNGKPIMTSGSSALNDGSVGTGFSNRREAGHIVPFIDQLLRDGGVFYRNASGALMLAYVASGRLLAYVEEHMNAWDCLAGLLLVEEAGGKIVKPDPSTVLTEGTVVIAACGGVFDRIEMMCASAFKLGLAPDHA